MSEKNSDLNPFWKGVFNEIKKVAIVDQASKVPELAAKHPEAAAGVAGAGLLAGITAVALGRKGRLPGFKKPKPSTPKGPAGTPEKKWTTRGLLTAGGLGAAGAAYATHKYKEGKLI